MTEENGEVRELQKGWYWVNLGDVCQEIETKKPELEPEWKFQYIDIASIDNAIKKIVSPKKYLGKDAPSRARQVVRVNDVVFSTVRTYLMNIAMVPEQLDGQIASTGFCVIRAANQIVPKYIFYFSISHRFINQLNELQRGTSYPAVRDRDIFAQPFPLCSTKEQERIVEKIEELFSELDQGVKSLKTAQKQLKIYRQAVLKWAFEGKLTEVWRKQHQSTLKTGEVLLAQIKAERENRDRQRLAEWETAVKEWEAIGKVGKKPSKPQQLKNVLSLTESDVSNLPQLPDSWLYVEIEIFLASDKKSMITGPFGTMLKKSDHREVGVPVLGIENIGNGVFIPRNKIFVSEEKAEELDSFGVTGGDIIISRSGTVGEICCVPEAGLFHSK